MNTLKKLLKTIFIGFGVICFLLVVAGVIILTQGDEETNKQDNPKSSTKQTQSVAQYGKALNQSCSNLSGFLNKYQRQTDALGTKYNGDTLKSEQGKKEFKDLSISIIKSIDGEYDKILSIKTPEDEEFAEALIPYLKNEKNNNKITLDNVENNAFDDLTKGTKPSAPLPFRSYELEEATMFCNVGIFNFKEETDPLADPNTSEETSPQDEYGTPIDELPQDTY